MPPGDGGPTTKLAVDASPGHQAVSDRQRMRYRRTGRRPWQDHPRAGERSDCLGRPAARFAGLRAATTEEVAPILKAADFPTSRIGKAVPTAQAFAGQPVAARSLAVRGSTGFGAPFTRSGFIIENSVGSFDFTIKDTGRFVSRMTIFREDNPPDRFNLTMAGVIKTAGLGRVARWLRLCHACIHFDEWDTISRPFRFRTHIARQLCRSLRDCVCRCQRAHKPRRLDDPVPVPMGAGRSAGSQHHFRDHGGRPEGRTWPQRRRRFDNRHTGIEPPCGGLPPTLLGRAGK